MRKLRLFLLATLALALAMPGAASALTFKIDNESGRPAEDVYVTISGANFDVPGMANDVPRKLSEVPNPLTVNTLESGRVYVSYGAPVTEGEPFTSPTSFDWAELTVKPNAADVANLTAVDQFAIGMRLDTFGAGGAHLDSVSATNSNTIFAALQGIPGGPEATIRNPGGEIVRVLSPVHASSYPDLSEYVRSLAGQSVTLHTGLFFEPFATSEYSGTFAADGSIELHGTTNPIGMAPPSIAIPGPELIEDIYTGAHTPNTGEGAIRRDLLAGFSAGFWGGRYGNDALAFCSNPNTTVQGSWCPNGFNQPAYAAARAGVEPYPTYEQYAATIAQYAEEYGNPYSDASGKVTVSLDQPLDGGPVETLQLTILPDVPASPAAPGPAASAPSAPIAAPAPAPVPVRFRAAKQARLDGAKLAAGKLLCTSACGKVRAVVRKGKQVLARATVRTRASRPALVLDLTRRGKSVLADAGKLKLQLEVWVTPPGSRTVHLESTLRLHGGG
jgi:hypothetical protein